MKKLALILALSTSLGSSSAFGLPPEILAEAKRRQDCPLIEHKDYLENLASKRDIGYKFNINSDCSGFSEEFTRRSSSQNINWAFHSLKRRYLKEKGLYSPKTE